MDRKWINKEKHNVSETPELPESGAQHKKICSEDDADYNHAACRQSITNVSISKI